MTNLYNTNSPLNRAERKNVNDTWQDILSRFAQLQRHINFLAGEDVEEILARIQTAIDGAQDATLSANDAVEVINAELIKIATAISNAESARDQANTAATNATEAAQEANTAKQNADVATLKANNAADAANTAKQNTETATQEARTATTNANNATNAAEQATEEAEAITKIMNTLKIELEALQTALNGIVATENARVEAEEERVTNELARIDAEDERNEKERTRITVETNRVNAENARVEAEEGRITNELARIAAENERNEKEATRTTAETNRVNAENTRIEAEEERTQAHHTLCELLNNFQSLSYDASSTYDFPAIVSYNGSTYIALQEVTGIVPNNDGINWRLVAQRGVDGDGSVSSVNGIFPDPSGNVQLNVASNWDSIEGKPSTFTPDTHKHAISDVDGLQNALDGKANSSHTHNISEIDNLQLTLDDKANKTPVTTTTDGLMIASDKQKLDNMNPIAVINELTSTSTDSALSANMGNTLNNNLTALDEKVTKHLDDYAHAKIFSSTNQSILSDTWTVLNFNVEEFDSDNMHDNSGNNSRLTVKKSGRYIVLGSVGFEANGIGTRDLAILKNGSHVSEINNRASSDIVGTYIAMNSILDLNIGDYVELAARQTSGRSLLILGANTVTQFNIVKVG